MSIRVECPQCGKGVKAPDKYAGKVAKCPGCGGKLSIPGKASPSKTEAQAEVTPSPKPATSEEILPASIACPFCAESIQPQAKKCKHCGEFLDESARPTAVISSSNAPLASSTMPPDKQTPPVSPHVTITHEHKAKTSFFRVGFGTGCGCLSVAVLAMGGCLVATGWFATEVSDSMDEVGATMAKTREKARREAEEEREDQRRETMARASLVDVVSASFKQPEQSFGGPSIILKITNTSDSPITRVYFHGVLQTPGRSVPWAEDDFNYEVAGGIEAGETVDLNLSPNLLSNLYNAHPDDGAVFDVTVVDVDFLSGDDP